MTRRNELLRTKAATRESKHKKRHLRIGSRIRERIGSSGKKENVMIQDPRIGTAPQMISGPCSRYSFPLTGDSGTAWVQHHGQLRASLGGSSSADQAAAGGSPPPTLAPGFS